MKNKEEKWCKICEQFLPVKQFPPDKKLSTGLHTYCRSCRSKMAIEYKKVNPEILYKDSHPEEYKKYQREYMKVYRQDKVIAKKNVFASLVNNYINRGYFHPEPTCCECGAETHTKAVFTKDYVKRNMGKTPNIVWLEKAIHWTCNNCITDKRRKYK